LSTHRTKIADRRPANIAEIGRRRVVDFTGRLTLDRMKPNDHAD